MKLFLNCNYHLLFSPKPITFMTTLKLHKNLMKLVLCGSPFDKWGNWETEQASWRQIQDSDLSVSAFKVHVQACGAITGSSELQTWWQGFVTPKPIPCARLTSSSNWKSKTLSFTEWQMPFIWAQKYTEEKEQIWAVQKVHAHLTRLLFS